MKKQPQFKPKKGQVDFTNIRWCPVVNCVVRYRGKILVVKRSPHMRLYPNYWNGISGFLDDAKSLDEKVYEELREELGIKPRDIKKISLSRPLVQDSPKVRKTWIVLPVAVDVATDKVTLDWEAAEYRWIKPAEAQNLKLLPGFREVLTATAALR